MDITYTISEETKYPWFYYSVCDKTIDFNACGECGYQKSFQCYVQRDKIGEEEVNTILYYECMRCSSNNGERREFERIKKRIEQGLGCEFPQSQYAIEQFNNIKNDIITEPLFYKTQEEFEIKTAVLKEKSKTEAKKIFESLERFLESQANS